MGDQIRVLIVDDHPLFRQGLRNVLSAQPDLVVVGEADDGMSALALAQQAMPDVVLMDVSLPRLNGLQATRRLKADQPSVGVIVLTAYDDEEQVYHAIRAGASAYFAKDVNPERLVEVIRTVAQGRYVVTGAVLDEEDVNAWLLAEAKRFGGGIRDNEAQFLAPLSPRETEILEMIVQGLSNKEIAYHLGISQQTVKNHVTAILNKLGVADRTQAAVYALRRGWMPLRASQERTGGRTGQSDKRAYGETEHEDGRTG